MIASHLLGMIDKSGLREDVRSFALGELVDDIAAKDTPDAHDLLLSSATVLPVDVADRARASAAKIAATRSPTPIWLAGLGRAVFRHARSATDSFGDQDFLVATFEHPGWRPHTFVITVDHNFNGLFKQVNITLEADVVERKWVEASGIKLEPVTAEELAERWDRAIEWYHAYMDPPVDEGVSALMPLVEARRRALPDAPRREEQWSERSGEEVERFVDAVLRSPQGRDLAGEGEARSNVLREIAEYRANHADGDLWRWSPTVAELGLLDWIPRKALLEDEEVDLLPEALRAVVRVAAERKGLTDQDLAETLEWIDHCEPDYRAAMADGSMQGPATVIAKLMRDDGVDFTDADAVHAWHDRFNARPKEERDALLGPALDRMMARMGSPE